MNKLASSLGYDETSLAEHGLPGDAFKSESIYQTECDSMFRDGWISIATAQQLKEPGDVLPVTIAGHSLLVTRDRDRRINVFFNVCRHKSAPLVEQSCSRRSTIVCPYHRWTYHLDGRLLGAPYYHGKKNWPLDSEFKASLGLIPVRFEIWWDIIFVNLSGEGQDFDEFVRPLEELLTDHNAQDISQVSSTDYETSANWKLVVDNFLDGYHVGFVHSQACSVNATLGQENLVLSEDIFGLRLQAGARDKPAKTAKPLPHFAGLPKDKQSAQQWFLLFPNTLFFVDPCWVQTIVVKPQRANLCTETLSIYVTHPEAVGDAFAEERTALHKVLNKVNTQDVGLLNYLQRTRSSEAGSTGNLIRWWDDVALAFQQSWLDKVHASHHEE